MNQAIIAGDHCVRTEGELIAATMALGAKEAGGPLASAEQNLCKAANGLSLPSATISSLRERIIAGEDPLGEIFSVVRSSEGRRNTGATYTPAPIVQKMIEWAANKRTPTRVIDPGVGSARFLRTAATAFNKAHLVGIDVDPLATLMTRANLAASGLGHRARVILGDFCHFDEKVDGTTLYVGNPPYVRHHQISPAAKDWLNAEAVKLGLKASKLSGLHVYFFLATALSAKPEDFGTFVTASEWLDVNYGALVRSLMLEHLGGESITVIDPAAQPFPDAAATATIATFEVGAKPRSVYFKLADGLDDLGSLGMGRKVHRSRLSAESRWSRLTRTAEKPPDGYVELGELCRVHRGAVTGANSVWIAGEHSAGLPESVLFPTITKAREVLEAQGLLADSRTLRRVIDIPPDLDKLDAAERQLVVRFIKVARSMGADKGYVARHRKAWWSVGLRAAAPIISTYMARRPPGFAINRADARHINIAHGLYPREQLSEEAKKALVGYLRTNISKSAGRTYSGGLVKFEPKELERVAVPSPTLLESGVTL